MSVNGLFFEQFIFSSALLSGCISSKTILVLPRSVEEYVSNKLLSVPVKDQTPNTVFTRRRAALEQVSFFSGYGVETGLLIDIYEKFGLQAIAQVDLLERIHHNQPLEALSKMSFAIIQTVFRKLESRFGHAVLEDVNRSMKLIRYNSKGYFLDVEEIAERERPPMIEVQEYLERKR